MSVSGVSSYLSSLYSSSALKAVGKAVKAAEAAKLSSFMLQEAPEEASHQEENIDGGQDSSGWWGEEGQRYLMSIGACRPPMVANIIGSGSYSKATAEARGKLDKLVDAYFEEVKAEYGCSADYMPYAPGLPEFDAKIEEQMKRSLYEKVEADPEAERLIKSIGGVWPPPDRLNLETMTYGPGAQSYGYGPWMEPPGT